MFLSSESTSTQISQIFIIAHFLSFTSSQTIRSVEIPDLGDWGGTGYCPEGEFVVGMRLKIEEHQGSKDDTGLNGVEFYCSKPWTTALTKISSSEQKWGEWGPQYFCPPFQFAYRFDIRSDDTTPGISDNAGVVNLKLYCGTKYGRSWTITGQGVKGSQHWGAWYGNDGCNHGSYICSLRTKVEEPQGGGVGRWDDSALTAIEVQCCPKSD